MWFVFPQLAGLGSSSTARAYAVSGLDEARAYLAHPVLGPRLREAAELAAAVQGRTASEVFGYPDDLKLRSSMTLFARAAPQDPVFTAVLDRYFGGDPDPRTIELLRMIEIRTQRHDQRIRHSDGRLRGAPSGGGRAPLLRRAGRPVVCLPQEDRPVRVSRSGAGAARAHRPVREDRPWLT